MSRSFTGRSSQTLTPQLAPFWPPRPPFTHPNSPPSSSLSLSSCVLIRALFTSHTSLSLCSSPHTVMIFTSDCIRLGKVRVYTSRGVCFRVRLCETEREKITDFSSTAKLSLFFYTVMKRCHVETSLLRLLECLCIQNTLILRCLSVRRVGGNRSRFLELKCLFP